MTLDFRADPKPESEGGTLHPNVSLRVYESSTKHSLVSFYFSGDEHGTGRGTRLTRDQVRDLADELDEYLGRVRVDTRL